MNYKEYNPRQTELFGYKPEDVLDEDHLSFFVDEMVETISMENFYDRTPSPGNPAYNPKLMLKVIFLGYATGITGSRKLQKHCRENLAFIHLTRGQRPKFRAICHFRVKHAENIKTLFPQMVQIAQKLNIAKIGRLILDGTKIRANANGKRTIKAEKYDDILKSIEEYIASSEQRDTEEDAIYGKEETLAELPKEIRSKSKRLKRLKEVIKQAKKEQLKKVNATDPEAKFMKDSQSNKKKPSYNVQVAVDASSGIIVGCEATDSTNDNKELEPMVKKVVSEQGVTPAKVDADSGYYSNDSIDELESQNIDTCIPSPHTAGKLHKASSVKTRDKKKYNQDDFTYDKETDKYTCPNDNRLSCIRSYKHRKRTIRIFRSEKSCLFCPDMHNCLLDQNKTGHKTLQIDPVYVRTREKFKQASYRIRYKQRSWIIERIFGHFKKNLKFTQFNLRGLKGAAIETALLCIGYNLCSLQHWISADEIGRLLAN